jgi:hypothetical protein
MKRNVAFLAILCLAILGLVGMAAAQDAKVAGTWNLTLDMGQGGGGAGGGGQAGGQGGGGGRGGPQTLTLTQDGKTLGGTLHGGRGDSPVTGTISGNNITFSVTRTTANGDVKTDYTGTVGGDSMTGTVNMRGNAVNWTAKRSTGN